MPLAVVTGANKGIGLSIVRGLVARYPSSELYRRSNKQPLLVYLTARSRERGEAAVRDVQASSLAGDSAAEARVEFRELDVTDEESVRGFARALEKDGRGVDVLVNNAGVALDGSAHDAPTRNPQNTDAESARLTLETNYFGALRLTAALLPSLIPPHGRVVNMASMLGKLNKYSPELTSAFREAASSTSTFSTATSDDPTPNESDDGDPTAPTTALMTSYLSAVAHNTHAQDGWPPSSPYAVSKAGVTSATMALAAHERARRPRDARLVNACCPGYVATDMTKGRGRKSVEQGAETPLLLALGDLGGVTGEFWEGGVVSRW